MRLLHAADLHLDSPFRGLSKEKALQRRRESRTVLDAMAALVRDREVVSANLLRPEDVQILRSGRNSIVAIFVPRAGRGRRPVYVGRDPYAGTYVRRGEGDYRCSRDEVDAMLGERERA